MSIPRNYVLLDNYIYISHLDDVTDRVAESNNHIGDNYRFWILPSCPESISDSMTNSFPQTTALGRTAPVYTFSNAGPRTIQIDISLHRDIMDDVNYGVSNSKLALGEDYVENLINALQAIALPKYNLSNRAVEPPMVAIRIANQIFIKGIVSGGVTVTWKLPILTNNKYAQADVSFSISEVDPYDATTVFKNGGFRGVVQTLKKGMNIED